MSIITLPSELKDAAIRKQLAALGLRWVNAVSWNEGDAALYQQAVARNEGMVTATGGLAVTTGSHTGRSPKDKFIVRNHASENTVWWEENASLTPAQFDLLKADMLAHARLKTLFVQDLLAGANPSFEIETRVITEFAWQALFMRHLLIKPVDPAAQQPKLTILCLPSFKADPARHGTRSETVIALDLQRGLVLIGGTHYAGEMKKAVFTVLNHLLPEKGVLPMHCSANVDAAGKSAIFFGLSGTGKTTLSADPTRSLIGDDEHGWSDDGLFNFEGGCYAKAVNLSAENEPQIFAAAERWATVLENVVLEAETAKPDFRNISLTENTRLAYPLAAIPNAVASGRAGHPSAIIMLTADAFGVLPPVAKLNEQQAMHHFMQGYTAKVAGTERGVSEPQATFSACFGKPFLTRKPQHYAELLRQKMRRHKVPCYLLNTGWTGGGHGVGKRFPLSVTRRILAAILDGSLEQAEMMIEPHFGLAVPVAIDGVPDSMLHPEKGWASPADYHAAAEKLVGLFASNAEILGIAEANDVRRIAAE